jgi:hypothetical protein
MLQIFTFYFILETDNKRIFRYVFKRIYNCCKEL